jgi:AcrR family transcriptional regulator
VIVAPLLCVPGSLPGTGLRAIGFEPSAMTPTDGRQLPPGSHGIPAELVARNQRERLVAAVAEACAEHGYADVSVADLARRAAVSTATFYKLFSGKRECALEAHRELLERLLEEVDRACAREGKPARLRTGVHTVLALLAADPPTARLLTVEVMALGPAGVESYDGAIEAFASRLRDDRGSSRDPSLHNVAWALVAGVAMFVGKRVMAGEAASLPRLEDELVMTLASQR